MDLVDGELEERRITWVHNCAEPLPGP
jgi:hypothetical protein